MIRSQRFNLTVLKQDVRKKYILYCSLFNSNNLKEFKIVMHFVRKYNVYILKINWEDLPKNKL